MNKLKTKSINSKNINILIFIGICFILTTIVNNPIIFSQDYHEVGLNPAGSQYDLPQKKDVQSEKKIKFSVGKDSKIIISIFENNNLVKLITYDNLYPGTYEYDFTNQLPGGNYICNISLGEINETFQLLLK